MNLDTIEKDKYTIKIDHANHYLEYLIKEGIKYEKQDAIEAKKEVVKRYPNSKFYVLAEGVEFFTLTKEAREYCAKQEFLDNTHCVAFYTRNLSLLFLGEIFNKINKPAVTTRFFSNREQAKEWLATQMKLGKAG